jgi:hypothetical protein|tara:strand:+ start:15725 stop:16393 length:669 start_codon:yes stop_codon:yes gene_type:complete
MKKKSLFKEHFNSIIGGVVTAKPFADNISLAKLVKEKYGNVDEEKVDVKGLTNELSSFGNLGETIFGTSNIKKIAEKLSWIANQAKNHTLSETEDWFDKITVNRNMKELTNLSKSFTKISDEANALQQRMGALYEDMGNILGRYYDMSEGHVDGHDTDDDMTPEKEDDSETKFTIEQGDYDKFFQGAMKKFGIDSPADLDDDEKKKFFNYVDANYKAEKETD